MRGITRTLWHSSARCDSPHLTGLGRPFTAGRRHARPAESSGAWFRFQRGYEAPRWETLRRARRSGRAIIEHVTATSAPTLAPAVVRPFPLGRRHVSPPVVLAP